MEGYIDIKIAKSETSDIAKPVATDTPPKTPGTASVQSQAVNTALINTGKQMMMQGIRQYGNITGDYATVEMVDTALGIGADLIMLSLGPVGVIAVGAKYTTQLITQSVSLDKSNRNIDFMRERMGSVAMRGSRYGD